VSFPSRILFHPGNSPVLFLYDWDVILKRLSYFGKDGPDFAILELEDGSYVQCAGEKTRLTVESRVYHGDRKFQHVVWGRGPLSRRPALVPCVDGFIDADASQVLKMRDAREIMRSFVEKVPVPPRYVSTDVSGRFEPIAVGVRLNHKAWDWPDRRPPNPRKA
jgi:hypothetical protein